MGRQDNDPTTVNSSIALLQERFRQLEKVKERRREGKELVRLLSSESQRSTSSSHKTPQQWLVVPQRSSHHDSLSLGLNLTSKQGESDHNSMKTSPSSGLWPQGASAPRNFDTSDVDTSLHL